MNTRTVASGLVREHGVTMASAMVGEWVRFYADKTTRRPHEMSHARMLRFYLGIDWQLHFNPNLPEG